MGNRNYRPFNAAELERLYALLKTIRDLYIAPSSNVDLTKLTLNELTGKGTRSAVILQFRLDSEYAELGEGRSISRPFAADVPLEYDDNGVKAVLDECGGSSEGVNG